MRALPPTFEPDRWVPPPELAHGYRVAQLARALRVDRQDLAVRAAADPAWFYPRALDFLGAQWLRPWSAVVDESDGAPFARWFPDGGTNLSWLACERWVRRATGPAIIWEGDGGETRQLSFAELAREVRRVATGLRTLGVEPGDVVTMHLPMIPEAVVTMLAAARIGAIVAPAFSGYGPAPLTERLRLAQAKVLVTADGLMRRGRRADMLSTALAAAAAAPSAPTVVVVPRLRDPLPAHPAVVPWETVASAGEAGEVETFDAGTPWLLAFTSGSSGKPKGAVHTHGGFPYSLMLELGLSADVGPGDRFSWPSDMGWLAGPMGTLGPLTLGATAVVFEGVADYPAPDRVWQLIERYHVTQYGLSPTTARTLAAAGERWVEPYDLASLRVIVSSGEPWTLPAWRWLHRHAGRGRIPIVNWSGGTEVGGCIVAGYPDVPTPAGRFSGPALGMAVDVVDDEGRSVTGEPGELVLTRSWPAMTRGLWGECDRYLEAYWSRFPGRWVQGDRAVRYDDGTCEIPGRSDDVLKVAGKRVGPAELESLATEVDGVVAAAAVGVDHPAKGQVPLVVVQSGVQTDEARVAADVTDRIMTAFGKPMRPAAVLVVPALPRTRSGKIHRRAVRAWVTGSDGGDLSSLDNPEAEIGLRLAALGRDDYDEFGFLGPTTRSVRREDLRQPDGDVLSVILWGDEKPELLLLHGGGQNAHTWDGMAVALNRPLAAVDLPGHGRSSHRADRDYWPWRNAEAVAAVLPEVADKPTVVVGMSLGGLSGIRLAAMHPELVRSLVIIDVTPSVHTIDMTAEERGASSLVSADPTFGSFAELVEATAAAARRSRESVVMGARHNSYRRADGRWAWRYDRLRAPGDPPLDFSALWRDLAAVACPIMLVRGGDSFHVPDVHAEEVRRRQPLVRLEIVADAGHAVQSVRPRGLAALIEDFAFGGCSR